MPIIIICHKCATWPIVRYCIYRAWTTVLFVPGYCCHLTPTLPAKMTPLLVYHSSPHALQVSLFIDTQPMMLFENCSFTFFSDERVHPVNMCLIPHTVNENQPSGIIAGQLVIDDSSSPLSSCAKQHCCPPPQSLGRQFDYQCHVDTPENNEAIPQLQKNVSSLFRLDDGFLLRTKIPLLYSNFKDSNGSVEVHFSCFHTRHPLQFIGQSLQVSVAGAVIMRLFN